MSLAKRRKKSYNKSVRTGTCDAAKAHLLHCIGYFREENVFTWEI